VKISKRTARDIEQTLRSIYIKIKREGRKVLKDFPITPAQFDVLQILYFGGKRRMSDISRVLGITKSTTTGLVSRLIDAGFVEKKRSDVDRRAYIIDISESGRALIEKVIERRIAYLQTVLSKFDRDRAKELKQILKELLNKMDSSETLRGNAR
jgi:DNA-binding MarR family transcriptional regulator